MPKLSLNTQEFICIFSISIVKKFGYSAGYQAYPNSRCVIPAKGFSETEYVNKKPLHHHNMIAKDGAMLLGDLCPEWFNKETGETSLYCFIITLPLHSKLLHMHSKASPLLLPPDMNLVNRWLDESINDPSEFEPLLQPHIPYDLTAQQIDKPSIFIAMNSTILIEQNN